MILLLPLLIGCLQLTLTLGLTLASALQRIAEYESNRIRITEYELGLQLERIVEFSLEDRMYSMMDAINERTRPSGGHEDDNDAADEDPGDDVIGRMTADECQKAIDRFVRDGWLQTRSNNRNNGSGGLWFGVRTLTDLRVFLQDRLDIDIMTLQEPAAG